MTRRMTIVLYRCLLVAITLAATFKADEDPESLNYEKQQDHEKLQKNQWAFRNTAIDGVYIVPMLDCLRAQQAPPAQRSLGKSSDQKTNQISAVDFARHKFLPKLPILDRPGPITSGMPLADPPQNVNLRGKSSTKSVKHVSEGESGIRSLPSKQWGGPLCCPLLPNSVSSNGWICA
jgi:hypothetical protein